jgi:hypothetical protein
MSGAQATKRCCVCEERKPVEAFAVRKGKALRSGEPARHSYCGPCQSVRSKAQWQRDKDKIKARHAAYWAKNQDKQREYRRTMIRKRANRYKSSPEYRAKQLAARKVLTAKLRQQMLDNYGRACVCCGDATEAFLTLEHTLRNGKAHRAEVGAGVGVYLDLRRRGWPKNEGLAILCMNCNWATRRGTECPHKTAEAAALSDLREAVRLSWARESQVAA